MNENTHPSHNAPKCVNCKNYEKATYADCYFFGIYLSAKCNSPCLPMDLVTGERYRGSPSILREDGNACGIEGKLFLPYLV